MGLSSITFMKASQWVIARHEVHHPEELQEDVVLLRGRITGVSVPIHRSAQLHFGGVYLSHRHGVPPGHCLIKYSSAAHTVRARSPPLCEDARPHYCGAGAVGCWKAPTLYLVMSALPVSMKEGKGARGSAV